MREYSTRKRSRRWRRSRGNAVIWPNARYTIFHPASARMRKSFSIPLFWTIFISPNEVCNGISSNNEKNAVKILPSMITNRMKQEQNYTRCSVWHNNRYYCERCHNTYSSLVSHSTLHAAHVLVAFLCMFRFFIEISHFIEFTFDSSDAFISSIPFGMLLI